MAAPPRHFHNGSSRGLLSLLLLLVLLVVTVAATAAATASRRHTCQRLPPSRKQQGTQGSVLPITTTTRKAAAAALSPRGGAKLETERRISIWAPILAAYLYNLSIGLTIPVLPKVRKGTVIDRLGCMARFVDRVIG